MANVIISVTVKLEVVETAKAPPVWLETALLSITDNSLRIVCMKLQRKKESKKEGRKERKM